MPSLDTDAIRRELLGELITEALEHLDNADAILDRGAHDGLGAEARDGLMRAMHSIKGAAGYMELTAIQGLAHALETVTQRLTGGVGDDETFCIDVLLAGTAELRDLVEHADAPRTASSELLEALQQLGAAGDPLPERRSPGLAEIFLDVARQQCRALRAVGPGLTDANPREAYLTVERALASLRSAAEYAGRADVLALLDGLGGERIAAAPHPDLIARLLDDLTPLLGAADAGDASIVSALPETAVRRAQPGEASTDADAAPTGPAPTAEGSSATGVGANGTLRVPHERVDALVSRVGELLTVRNQFDHFLTQVEAAGVASALSRQGRVLAAGLGRVVDDLQSTAMELRLVRLDTIFRRLPRICRDAAAQTMKEVRLDLRGGDTELDKTVAEALVDPLLHLLRNAVDHGIERPADRRSAGKPETGLVIVAARSEASEVVIEVRDDGCGIDIEKVRASVVARGLLDAATAGELTAEGVIDLLFQPGFSTAATVTDISGRGVGLDVVRANATRLGGSVTVRRLDVGTAFELRLPVRLAATDVVLTRVGGETFAVAIDDIRETLSVPRERTRLVAGRPSIVQHGRVVPLVPLAELLGLPAADDADGGAETPLDVIMTEWSGQPVGLVVEEIGRHQQVVTKPLVSYLASPGLSGAAVLGDGRVVLVVAPRSLSMPMTFAQ